MFHKLRLRLTLINVAVMTILLLIFVAGTYFVMQAEIFNQSQQLMQMIAKDAGSGPVRNQRSRHIIQYFFVKTDDNGKITETSSDLPLQPEQVAALVQKVSTEKGRGEVDWQDQSYSYLRMPLATGGGYVLVFLNVEREHDLLGFLLLALLAVGLASLFLAFYASLFLANKALVPIKNSWQRQKDFVADASHELRTPLAVVQTNLELVMGNREDSVASQLNWLDNMYTETKRMSKLVEDLLFLARADSEQQLFETKTFSLSAALDEAIKPFNPLAEFQGVRLTASLDTKVLFYGDENRIKQLLVIFLDNALKHTPPGGEVRVTMQSGNEVMITVSDTGEGISREHLDKIFQRFYRVDKSRARSQGGSGLGLSIADWIVKSHNGNIQVTSTPGEGTTFTITLPNREVK